MLAKFLVSTLALCGIASAVGAQEKKIVLSPDVAFGARERVKNATLSPDGKLFAYVAPFEDRGSALYTVSLAGDGTPKRIAVASGNPEKLNSCGWASNVRLICSIYATVQNGGDLSTRTRLIAIDADGSNFKGISRPSGTNALYFSQAGGDVLDWLPNQDGKVLLMSYFVPVQATGSLVERSDEGFGVERVDTRSLSRERIVKPFKNAVEYITDGKGTVRLVGLRKAVDAGYTTGEIAYLYRPAGSNEWKSFDSYFPATRDGFNPYGVDPATNLVYGLKKKDGRLALYTRSLDDAMVETLVLARPDVDVDELIRIGRQQHIVGASYAADTRVGVYFDPEIAAVLENLRKALPASSLVNVVEASQDERKLLIWAGADNDPGRYFLFDRDAKQLRPLLLNRPELGDRTLAQVRSVQVRAQDGTMVPAYLTLPPGSNGKNLPTIVMPHGGPSARDEWGFDWLSQYYADRGFAVLQPNYRGSSGYGDSWLQGNGFKAWRIAIADIVSSGRWLVDQGIADPKKLAIVGWSYGGYAALQSGVMAPDLFKAIVAIAPVTDLVELRDHYQTTTAATEARDMIGTGPELREGSPARHADAIKAPVMLFHGTYDQNVPYRASQLMDSRLRAAGKQDEFVTYTNLAHNLDDSGARADMLKRSDNFLRRSLGM